MSDETLVLSWDGASFLGGDGAPGLSGDRAISLGGNGATDLWGDEVTIIWGDRASPLGRSLRWHTLFIYSVKSQADGGGGSTWTMLRPVVKHRSMLVYIYRQYAK